MHTFLTFRLCWCFQRNMMSRRRKLKYLILGSCLLLFYLYIFMSSSSIENILSQDRARSVDLISSGNRTKMISPFEGPVEDLVGPDNFKARLLNRGDTAHELFDAFANDRLVGARSGEWKAGFRVKPGFSNPLKRIGQGNKNVEAQKEEEEDIIDQLEEDPRDSFQQDHNPGRVGQHIPLAQFLQKPFEGKLTVKPGGDSLQVQNKFVRQHVQQTLRNVQTQSMQQKVQVEVAGDPLYPPVNGSFQNNLLLDQTYPFRVRPHSAHREDLHMVVPEVTFVNSGEDWIEVSKNKTYDGVKFPFFVEYGKPGDPGELGTKVIFQHGELTKEQEQQRMKDFEDNYFDEWISRKIAIHRTLPDERKLECTMRNYSGLSAVSVLMVFYNEAWTTLLRSIHSILDRTPPHLLLEIVLFDDFSDMDHLKEPLEAYLKPLEKVKLFRAKKRLGLIRARNMAFELSRGDVVVFLDSHIECFPGWLEPLLSPIHFDSRTVTFPVIELINPRAFSLKINQHHGAVGGLILNTLSFNWLYERKFNSTSVADNSPSPTMPGGLYAISRDYFRKLGQYDPNMDFWGGENIEISFKAWMCGGSILMVGCSHIGHVFRQTNPALKGVVLGYKNVIRVAEVWMDHYKHIFYEKIAYNIHSFGDVSERVKLRKSLQCRDFGWYLQYVFPELKKAMDLNSIYAGQIISDALDLCIDRHVETHLAIDKCKDNSIFQHWNLDTNGTLVSGERIIGLRTVQVRGVTQQNLGIFRPSQIGPTIDATWVYDDKRRFVHKKTGLCLQAFSRQREAVLKPCSTTSREQQWKMTTRQERKDTFRKKGIPIDWSV